MSNLEDALRMLGLALGRLEQASVGPADIPAVQGARADLERVMEVLRRIRAEDVVNPALALRTVARALQPISEPKVRVAWADTVEAAMLLEDSMREWLPK